MTKRPLAEQEVLDDIGEHVLTVPIPSMREREHVTPEVAMDIDKVFVEVQLAADRMALVVIVDPTDIIEESRYRRIENELRLRLELNATLLKAEVIAKHLDPDVLMLLALLA